MVAVLVATAITRRGWSCADVVRDDVSRSRSHQYRVSERLERRDVRVILTFTELVGVDVRAGQARGRGALDIEVDAVADVPAPLGRDVDRIERDLKDRRVGLFDADNLGVDHHGHFGTAAVDRADLVAGELVGHRPRRVGHDSQHDSSLGQPLEALGCAGYRNQRVAGVDRSHSVGDTVEVNGGRSDRSSEGAVSDRVRRVACSIERRHRNEVRPRGLGVGRRQPERSDQGAEDLSVGQEQHSARVAQQGAQLRECRKTAHATDRTEPIAVRLTRIAQHAALGCESDDVRAPERERDATAVA